MINTVAERVSKKSVGMYFPRVCHEIESEWLLEWKVNFHTHGFIYRLQENNESYMCNTIPNS